MTIIVTIHYYDYCYYYYHCITNNHYCNYCYHAIVLLVLSPFSLLCYWHYYYCSFNITTIITSIILYYSFTIIFILTILAHYHNYCNYTHYYSDCYHYYHWSYYNTKPEGEALLLWWLRWMLGQPLVHVITLLCDPNHPWARYHYCPLTDSENEAEGGESSVF